MKRVLILVFLIVSLVELDLERYRFYLFLSVAAFAALVRNVRMSRRRAQNARRSRAFAISERDWGCLSAEQDGVAYAPAPMPPEGNCESVESAHSSLSEEALVHDNST